MKLVLPMLLLALSAQVHAGRLYKCVDKHGKVEYASSPCHANAKQFDPEKGRGSVTRMKLPKVEAPAASSSSSPIMTEEQKRQMDELGVKPGGAVKVKPLVIPESWLK
ncbi:MAG: DUF4124 domain-containing protein [Betaproteobacteria bacterium]|nr:DUF4124 domain-containing protein [Betaproteobacteria bacterium]